MKACTKCAGVKPLTEFYVRRDRNSHDSDCKECAKAPARDWHRKNPEKSRSNAAAWKAKNPAKCDEHEHKSNMRKYGITPEIYDMFFILQQGECGICGRHQSEFKKRLAVDHNHETGRARALLCANCNKGIGNLQESPSLLRFAADYLERFDK